MLGDDGLHNMHHRAVAQDRHRLPGARDPRGEIRRDGKGKPIPSYQFTRMAELANSAREIVNAGDIDREGQLIVDEFPAFLRESDT